MEPEKLFGEYFQDELNNQIFKVSNIHVIAIIPTTDGEGIEVRYMPVWDFDEIEKCMDKIFNDLEKNYVEDLLLKWGGISHFVLELATLKDAICVCGEYIFKYIGQSESPKDISHMLLHIVTNTPKIPKTPIITNIDDEVDVDEIDVGEEEALEMQRPFTIKIIKFASQYVTNEVVDQIRETLRERLQCESLVSLEGEKSNQLLGKYDPRWKILSI
ncbi:hypothetical protein RclHR1_08970009 [Rhizophagus clarus]|nr:hypothetical protein RclHR1_08970009 [Rhizophagus clarus]GES73520.1 hypothetical protein RCL_jg4006.t1 [Rhizophagus clarus]